MHIVTENMLTVYPELIDAVSGGTHISPRGLKVVECPLPLVWTLRCPQQWALTIPGRRMNPFFALAEVVWMWSGKSGADFITYYNKSFGQFLDPGIPYFNAAYGARIRHYGYKELPFRNTPYPVTTGLVHEPVEVDQLDFVINRLRADPSTRQAVVSLWDPIKDNFHTSKDYPCNNMVYFSNRDGQLNITVVIRSNDLIWGTPHNMIQFSHLQALIAGTLDLKMGWFTVMCNNLHYYEDQYIPTLDTVLKWRENVKEASPEWTVEGFSRALHDPDWDMRWNLHAFDLFVREVWEPLERDMRHQESKVSNASQDPFCQVQHMRLEDFCNRYDVPEYWQHLFTVMFMYHCRKLKAMMVFNELSMVLPNAMRWLINDFITKGEGQ